MKKFITIFGLIAILILTIGCEFNQTTTTESTTSTTTTITTTTTTTTQTTTLTTSYATESSTSADLTTTELSTELVEYTGIEITQQYDMFFNIDEPFDKDSIQLTAYKNDGTSEVIPSTLFSVRGYTSSTPGPKNLFIIFDQFLVETTVYVLEDFAFPIEMSYYENAINLRGDYLRVVLNNIISDDFIPLLYGDARYILPESDVDPNNSNNIMLIYTGDSVNSDWDGGITWNREHIFPQSRLGIYVGYGEGDYPSMATDIHNLKPADPDENAIRSNDYFSDVDNSETYVPRNDVRGDIARILFYMITRYPELSLNDDETTDSYYRTMGVLSVLIEWNELDPVDDFERHRNDVIYNYQGNRNPYIDYPEFINLIWGDQTN